MIWKLALASSCALNIIAAGMLYAALRDQIELEGVLEAKDRRISDLEMRPEAITTLTEEQFATFLSVARGESGSDALPR